MKQIDKNKIVIPNELKTFSYMLMNNFHKDTNELHYKHNNTQKKCIEIICDILQECYNRNKNNKEKNIPVLIPLSPNKYSPNSDWIYLNEKKYKRTHAKLAIKCLVHFNIITVEYGYIKLEKNEWNNKKDWMKLESMLTQVWVKPISEWKPIYNITKESNYTQFDLQYMFLPDSDIKKKPAICRKQIYNEKGKPLKHSNGKKVKYPIPVHESYYDPIYTINNFFIEKGYQNLQYHRIFGDTPDEFGRIYGPFQNLSKIERKNICNEMNWVELDFKSFVPSILYEISTGKKCTEDIYKKALNHLDLPIEYRPMFKPIILYMTSCLNKDITKKSIRNILSGQNGTGCYSNLTDSISTIEELKNKLNEKSYQENIEIKKHNEKNPNKLKKYKNYYELKKYQFKKYLIENNFDLNTPHYVFNIDYIMNEIEKLFPYFKPFLYNSSCKLTQNIESEITLEISKIMISLDILPLSIHDSYIIPKIYEKYFNNLMNKIKFYYTCKYRLLLLLNNNIYNIKNNNNKTIHNTFNYNISIKNTVMNCKNKNENRKEEQKKPP